MNKIVRFKQGDWIVNEDGICQVYDSIDYYVEEFCKHEFDNLKVGDAFQNKVVYKIFCHFDRTPRKTKFFNFISSRYCEALEGKYLKTFESCKADHPDQYEKFLTRKPAKPLTARVEFSLRFEPDIQEMVIKKMNDLFKAIPKPFNYEEFDKYFRENVGVELPEKLYAERDTMRTNTLVSLVYRVLEPGNKKFSFVGGIAIKTYCAFDER